MDNLDDRMREFMEAQTAVYRLEQDLKIAKAGLAELTEELAPELPEAFEWGGFEIKKSKVYSFRGSPEFYQKYPNYCKFLTTVDRYKLKKAMETDGEVFDGLEIITTHKLKTKATE